MSSFCKLEVIGDSLRGMKQGLIKTEGWAGQWDDIGDKKKEKEMRGTLLASRLLSK